jgi:hypothetical protein
VEAVAALHSGVGAARSHAFATAFKQLNEGRSNFVSRGHKGIEGR